MTQWEEFAEKIRELALEYDRDNGRWPENKYEGSAFYRFVCQKLGVPFKPYPDSEVKSPRDYGEWHD